MAGLYPYFSKDSFEMGIEHKGAYFAFDEIKPIDKPGQVILRSALFGSQDIYIMPLIDGVSFCYCRIRSKNQVSVLQNPAPQQVVTLSFLVNGHLNYDIQPNARYEINHGFAFIDAPDDRSYNLIRSNMNILSVDFHFDQAKFLSYFYQLVDCSVVSADYKDICLSLNPSKAPKVAFSSNLHALFLQILHCPFHGAQRELYFESKTTEVLIHYFHELQKTVDSKKLSMPALSKSEKEKLCFLKEYLDKNALSPLTLKDLSSMMGMSETSIQLKFKKLFGTTIIQYHRRQSLKTAYDFLHNGESIKSVSYLCGYNSPASFSKAFYNAYGLRPSKVGR